MKTTQAAAIGGASIIALVALLLAIPAMAAPNGLALATNAVSTSSIGATTNTTSTSIIPAPTALTVGQTITFTSTNGGYRIIGSHDKVGTASGTMVLTVTGAYKGGYSLSLTSGSLALGNTTYTMGSGSAEMGPHQAHVVGQGNLAVTPVGSTNAPAGTFLFEAGAHANFQGNTYNTLRLDVQVNGVEYGVLLLVTAQVA
jgi:hypothetical protein